VKAGAVTIFAGLNWQVFGKEVPTGFKAKPIEESEFADFLEVIKINKAVTTFGERERELSIGGEAEDPYDGQFRRLIAK